MSHRHPEDLGKYFADISSDATVTLANPPPLEPCVGCGRSTRGRRDVFELEVPACSDQCAKAAGSSMAMALGARMGCPH